MRIKRYIYVGDVINIRGYKLAYEFKDEEGNKQILTIKQFRDKLENNIIQVINIDDMSLR